MPGPVAGGTLGRTTIGTTPSSGLSANFSRGGEHGATGVPNEAVAMGIWASLDGKGGGTGTQQVRAAVYEGDAQENDWLRSKVYESEVVTIPAGMSGRWVRFPFKSPIFFSSSLGYWLMLQSGSTGASCGTTLTRREPTGWASRTTLRTAPCRISSRSRTRTCHTATWMCLFIWSTRFRHRRRRYVGFPGSPPEHRGGERKPASPRPHRR